MIGDRLDLKTGWITREGVFLHAPYRLHYLVCEKFGISEGHAEGLGWLKIVETHFYISPTTKGLNKKQKTKLLDWCIENKIKYEEPSRDKPTIKQVSLPCEMDIYNPVRP